MNSKHHKMLRIFNNIYTVRNMFDGSVMANVSDISIKKYASGTTVDLGDVFKLYCLESSPELSITLDKDQAITYYKHMQTIRRMENTSSALYKKKEIRGFCHLYSGEEACAVGIKSVMRDNDSIITAYRCHGWSYLMNVSVYGVLAELMGRKTGCSRGKGGSMHMYSRNYFGGNGIVGAQVPIGTGISLKSKYKGDGGVCFTLYGDGAANQGQVFESFNMACLWKLPTIFVCENNKYGMGTSAERSSCNVEYYTRGDLIPGLWVDGMSVLAVRSAAQFAIDYVLKNGPLIMEMSTYRYSGHSMSDPGVSYRSRDEIQDVRKTHDPIANFRNLCIEKGVLTEKEMNAIDEEVRKVVDEAVAKSQNDPEVELKELTADVYSNNLEPNIRGITGYNLFHMQINKGANR